MRDPKDDQEIWESRLGWKGRQNLESRLGSFNHHCVVADSHCHRVTQGIDWGAGPGRVCLNGNGPGEVLCVDRTPRLGRLAQRPQPGSVTCRSHGPMPAVGRAPAPRAALTSRPIELIPAITWHQHTLPHCSHSATQVAAARGEGPLRRLRRRLRAVRRHCSPPDGARAGQISRSRPLAGSSVAA